MTINVEIIRDSITPDNDRLTTFKLTYPRFIHSEFMTHRDFSRNAASSRAVPILKAVKLVWKDIAQPIHWGKKKAGMQAEIELGFFRRKFTKLTWVMTGLFVSLMTLLMKALGAHKQVANRMLEPWTHMTVIMTTARIANWETLRIHKDAQPEIQALARAMRAAMKMSKPIRINWGGWHLPYVSNEDLEKFGVETCLKISSACCAQVSYRNLDTSIDTALRIYDRLVKADVIHASPFEHCAQAQQGGGTGNFTGNNWMQYRHVVENTVKA